MMSSLKNTSEHSKSPLWEALKADIESQPSPRVKEALRSDACFAGLTWRERVAGHWVSGFLPMVVLFCVAVSLSLKFTPWALGFALPGAWALYPLACGRYGATPSRFFAAATMMLPVGAAVRAATLLGQAGLANADDKVGRLLGIWSGELHSLTSWGSLLIYLPFLGVLLISIYLLREATPWYERARWSIPRQILALGLAAFPVLLWAGLFLEGSSARELAEPTNSCAIATGPGRGIWENYHEAVVRKRGPSAMQRLEARGAELVGTQFPESTVEVYRARQALFDLLRERERLKEPGKTMLAYFRVTLADLDAPREREIVWLIDYLATPGISRSELRAVELGLKNLKKSLLTPREEMELSIRREFLYYRTEPSSLLHYVWNLRCSPDQLWKLRQKRQALLAWWRVEQLLGDDDLVGIYARLDEAQERDFQIVSASFSAGTLKDEFSPWLDVLSLACEIRGYQLRNGSLPTSLGSLAEPPPLDGPLSWEFAPKEQRWQLVMRSHRRAVPKRWSFE